jgi:phosphoribosylformimino-5-aminoimidazole carboxamide ribotide isomerase
MQHLIINCGATVGNLYSYPLFSTSPSSLFLLFQGQPLDDTYYVGTDRWQKYTSFAVTPASLLDLAQYCDEFLVHGVENEGKRCGILDDLVELLAQSPIPVTYAGQIFNSISFRQSILLDNLLLPMGCIKAQLRLNFTRRLLFLLPCYLNFCSALQLSGGVNSLADLDRVETLGHGKVDLTIGSALDVFGGDLSYEEVCAWHNSHNPTSE